MFIDTRDKVPRKFYISRRDAQKYGYTKNCPGCTSWLKGESRKPHTNACRDRFAELMRGQAKYENSQQRMMEFEAKQEGRLGGRKREREGDVGDHSSEKVQKRLEDHGGMTLGGLEGREEDLEDPGGRTVYGGGRPSGSSGPEEVETGEDQGGGIKRKGEGGLDDEGGKRSKNRSEPQGTKRKVEEEEEDIRRLIEEEVDRVNPGWVKGEPAKMRDVGRVEIAQVTNLVGSWVQEVKNKGFEDLEFKGDCEAWDDVRGDSCLIS